VSAWSQAALIHCWNFEDLSSELQTTDVVQSAQNILECISALSSNIFGPNGIQEYNDKVHSYNEENHFSFIAKYCFSSLKKINPAITSMDICNLLVSKQKDYGKNNIEKFGIVGILIRLSDKVERLLNIMKKSSNLDVAVQDEPVYQTLADIIGYCVIAKMFVTEVSINQITTKEFYLSLD
jgi:hypothetical protein